MRSFPREHFGAQETWPVTQDRRDCGIAGTNVQSAVRPSVGWSSQFMIVMKPPPLTTRADGCLGAAEQSLGGSLDMSRILHLSVF